MTNEMRIHAVHTPGTSMRYEICMEGTDAGWLRKIGALMADESLTDLGQHEAHGLASRIQQQNRCRPRLAAIPSPPEIVSVVRYSVYYGASTVVGGSRGRSSPGKTF